MRKIKLRAAAALATAFALFTSVMPASFAEYDPDVIPVYEDAAAAEELSVAAAAPETSKFSYNIENGTLTVSLNAAINNRTGKDVDAIIAVYDGDVLLQTKIYKLSGDYEEMKVKDWQTNVPDSGNIRVRAFLWTADGKCTPLEEASELSNVPSTAYKVYGRVMATSKGFADGLKKDEVRFNVERSDNFDGYEVSTQTGSVRCVFKTGSTNARDMLFIYSEAYVVKDPDTDEYTLMSIKPYGDPKTVTFAADDVADDDASIEGIRYVEYAKLPVYKDKNSSSTTKYDLSEYAIMYVNGVEIGIVTNDRIAEYILNNPAGSVTLIDRTDVGSTASDGKYDYIMVDYYIDAVVDYTITTSSKAKIYFKVSQTRANKMEWDPNDPDVDITFTKDGKKINYTELNEFDILTIQYNIVDEGTGSDSLTDKMYYEVLVSSDTADGEVTSIDTDDDTITINDKTYDLNTNMVGAYDFEIGTRYKVYLDVFGRVAYFGESAVGKDYGVIVAMYQENGRDYPTVRLVTSNGEIVAYECKDDAEARMFYEFATDSQYGYQSNSFTKTSIADRIKSGETVCTYKLSGGKIRFDREFWGNGGNDLEYKASSNRLGTYQIGNEETKIIDMDEYMNGYSDSPKVRVLTTDSFEDEANYDAWLFDKNADGVYRFAIVFRGTSSIRPESQIAVVKSANGQKDVDSNTCNAYTVFKGGQETELLVDDVSYAPLLFEGDVVAYTLNSDGYAEAGNVYRLFTMGQQNESYYDVLLNQTLEKTEFNKMLNQNVLSDNVDGKSLRQKAYDNGALAIAYNGVNRNKEVYAYAGVVYKKTDKYFELLTSQSDGESHIMDAVDFALDADTNVYTYDFGKASGKGLRVVYGNSPIQNTSVFNEAYINYNNTIAWSNAGEAKPQLAFVKEVDGKTTDVVFYVPADYDEGEAPEPDTEADTIDYGVIVAMYKNAGDDYPTVRLVTANAEVVEYECKDAAEADNFYNYATGTYNGYQGYGFKKTDDAVRYRILNGETVCTYKLSDDRISFDMKYEGVGASELEYKASSSKLGSYSISDDTTRIIDMDEYMSWDSGKVRALSLANFEDEAEYNAWLFDRNSAGVYRFAIVFSGTSSIRPESQIAVVKSANGTRDVDSNTCNAYTVFKGGQETELLVEGSYSAPSLYEGDIVAYVLNSDGYAEAGNLYRLFTMGNGYDSYYDAFLDQTLAKTNFNEMLNSAVMSDMVDGYSLTNKAAYNGARAIAYNGRTSSNKEVYAYFGIVYNKTKSNVELFTKQDENGVADVNAVTDFSLSGADIYTFDFAERRDKGIRLSVGNSAPQNTSIYNQAYVWGSDKNMVDFDNLDGATPQLAFIKEVDGDVTDAVFFVAP